MTEHPDASARDWRQAVLRGLRGRCPSCAKAPLFARLLTPIDRCPACGQDWTAQRADDFPSYLVILILGHVMVPLVVAANLAWDWPEGLQMALWPALAAMLALALIRPAKGAVIGAQWALGMGGFGGKAPLPASRDGIG
ncbi:MAG TPA: DUF983 domain-containing protein [Sphingomonas sp.]